MASPVPVFEARSLTKVYYMGEVAVHALRGVDLDLFQSESVVILEPSGRGKSMLLNLLGGLDVPTSGTVRYRDHDLTAADERGLTQYRRRWLFTIGFLKLTFFWKGAVGILLWPVCLGSALRPLLDAIAKRGSP
jgi:predicted ABC-type transport system involved in lysophospholipase L1 biosynthesis ATPase subunit